MGGAKSGVNLVRKGMQPIERRGEFRAFLHLLHQSGANCYCNSDCVSLTAQKPVPPTPHAPLPNVEK